MPLPSKINPALKWRLCLLAVLASMQFAAPCQPAAAEPTDGKICIDPDIEFPVPCDEDDD